jgi:hypothetical protein
MDDFCIELCNNLLLPPTRNVSAGDADIPLTASVVPPRFATCPHQLATNFDALWPTTTAVSVVLFNQLSSLVLDRFGFRDETLGFFPAECERWRIVAGMIGIVKRNLNFGFGVSETQQTLRQPPALAIDTESEYF